MYNVLNRCCMSMTRKILYLLLVAVILLLAACDERECPSSMPVGSVVSMKGKAMPMVVFKCLLDPEDEKITLIGVHWIDSVENDPHFDYYQATNLYRFK